MKINMERTALAVVDVQNDFCPGGSLAVNGGDEIIKTINKIMPYFGLTVATQDWHPQGHVSFASSYPGVKPFEQVHTDGRSHTAWPDHCVMGEKGAEFHPELDTRHFRMIVRKGFRPELDSYSAFFENDGRTSTGLNGYLKSLGMRNLVLCGLALDVCVYYTALDARKLGYNVFVLLNASRAVNTPEGSADKTLKEMQDRGIVLLDEWSPEE